MLVAVQFPITVLMLPVWWLSRTLHLWLHRERWTFLLRCTLQLAGSLAVASSWLCMMLCQYSVPFSSSEGRRFAHPVQLGPCFLLAYFFHGHRALEAKKAALTKLYRHAWPHARSKRKGQH